MAAGGRFVQVSDGLPVAETPLDIAALAPGGFFAVVDIDVAMKLDSQRYRLLVQKILAAGAAGEVTRPVPTDFPFARLSDALRPTAAGDRLGDFGDRSADRGTRSRCRATTRATHQPRRGIHSSSEAQVASVLPFRAG